ncbi:hypothetical protein C8R44DRAFT_755418 [Mycena epipterygia]|nr:hypothetical protein C8R44DRAFT_755418 [Mycena epipterygia]
MASRVSISEYRPLLLRLLLTAEELEEIGFYVISCLGTIAMNRIRSAASTAGSIRHDVEFYSVPSEACNMFSLILQIADIVLTDPEDLFTLSIAHPIVVDFWLTTHTFGHASGLPSEYPEFDGDGVILRQSAGSFPDI